MNKNLSLILNEIKGSKLIAKHVIQDTWISGSSTEVFPITIWENCNHIVVQLKDRKNYYKNFLQKIEDKYKDILQYACFCRNDLSCPCTLEFKVIGE